MVEQRGIFLSKERDIRGGSQTWMWNSDEDVSFPIDLESGLSHRRPSSLMPRWIHELGYYVLSGYRFHLPSPPAAIPDHHPRAEPVCSLFPSTTQPAHPPHPHPPLSFSYPVAMTYFWVVDPPEAASCGSNVLLPFAELPLGQLRTTVSRSVLHLLCVVAINKLQSQLNNNTM